MTSNKVQIFVTMNEKQVTFYYKAVDTLARNLRKFFNKYLHSYVGKQYPNNIMSTHNHRNLLENMRKFIARVSPV